MNSSAIASFRRLAPVPPLALLGALTLLCALAAYAAPAAALEPGDAQRVPFVSERSAENIAGEIEWAVREGRTGEFTLAVSEDGAWSTRVCGNCTPQDRVRATLQKCEHIAQGACGLVVADGAFVGPFQTSARTLVYATTFDPAAIPFVRDELRERIARDYGSARGHKALALTRNGRAQWVDGRASAQKAQEEVLSRCNERDGRNRCFLYALGETVVFDAGTDIYPER